MSDLEGYWQALRDMDAYALEVLEKAEMREGQAYEHGHDSVETHWHAVARTASLFHDWCQERLPKKDAK